MPTLNNGVIYTARLVKQIRTSDGTIHDMKAIKLQDTQGRYLPTGEIIGYLQINLHMNLTGGNVFGKTYQPVLSLEGTEKTGGFRRQADAVHALIAMAESKKEAEDG